MTARNTRGAARNGDGPKGTCDDAPCNAGVATGCGVTDNHHHHHHEGKERIVPLEIDDHFRLYGKEPWEVEYGEKCPDCQSRIDELGFCSCGSSGD